MLGAGWGRRGVPSEVVEEGKKHQVKTISMVKSIEEARDAIANGYALSVCSTYGFSSRRDKHGIASRSGSWNHAMAWVAMDDSHEIYNETLFLVQNSWGVFNGGPKRFEQPDGSFWIRERDAAGMLNQNGAWAFSDVDGFPPRKVDWTIDEVF
jgi:C1A family cysteine protease